MKIQTFVIGTLLVSMAVLPLSASANAETQAARLAAQQQNQQAKITQLIALGDKEINRRLTAMNGLVAKINALKKLTAAQKSDLSSQVQANITSLTNLKTKIDADTDLATLKTDVQSVITDYRIFAIFMPKINLLAQADRAQEVANAFTALSTKLETRLNTAKANGKDVTSLEADRTDMNTKIADANTQITAAVNLVATLGPSNYPSKAQFQQAQADLRAARADFNGARTDAKNIIDGLIALK